LVLPAGYAIPPGKTSSTAAGWPFFGQFVAHDITADRSPIADHADLESVRNFRTPRANLEAVYGGGPVGSPYLYSRDDPAKLLLGVDGRDVPRNQEGLALIGDPRNDVHLFVNQLHLLWLRVHNLLVDRLREDGVPEADVFDEARRAALWHYQWLILHDFLPTTVGHELALELLEDGPRFYRPDGEITIPLEFADAAYRYGHGQIRETYVVDDGLRLPLFPDLMGFQPVAHDLDWATVFDLPDRPHAQRSRRLDGSLPQSLIHLPVQITGDVSEDAYHSLAARDLQRGLATGLPSGEAVARAIGAEPLSAHEVGLAANGWTGETPLWFYLLRESDMRADGSRLGPVGGRIVGEVLVALIDADSESYRAIDREWQPTLFPQSSGGSALGSLIAAVTG
jgi:Animal haem peroxidase